MLDARLEAAEDADQVVRALNVLVLKMVEKSDHTAMTRCVFFRLLTRNHLKDTDDLIEFVVRCSGCSTMQWAVTTQTASTLSS